MNLQGGLDLVGGSWLSAAYLDGEVRDGGVLEVLTGAHEIRRLDLPVATMTPALLRQLLLPVVLDALGAPRSRREWGERFKRGRFSPEEIDVIGRYLTESYGDRFHLDDEERPFGQVAGLAALSGDVKPSTLLVPSIASGNNVPVFGRRVGVEYFPGLVGAALGGVWRVRGGTTGE